MESLKVTIVGDGAVGKTCLLLTYTTGNCPGDYIPTIFDNYNQNVLVDGKLESLSLWDTAGQEDYDRLRPLSYPGTDVFLACYSTTNPHSLNNLKNKWLNEIRFHCGKDATIVLVGTKSDARNDPKVIEKLSQHDMEPVTSEMGRAFAKENGIVSFIECSSLTQENVKETFIEAVIVGRKSRANQIEKQRRAKRGFVSRLGRLLSTMGF
mmetsp:Transcript_40696/g.52433  ORF Transcript_40696/g.52433 Transcript_40696/m.52433 type:complete len:209 (+) Transcript_40696:62-688(+)